MNTTIQYDVVGFQYPPACYHTGNDAGCSCHSFLLSFFCFLYFCLLSSFSSVIIISLSLASSSAICPPLPLHQSAYAALALSLGTCITVRLLVFGQLPHSSLLALLHPPPPSCSVPLPILHVCQGPGGSTECTAQWPKSE